MKVLVQYINLIVVVCVYVNFVDFSYTCPWVTLHLLPISLGYLSRSSHRIWLVSRSLPVSVTLDPGALTTFVDLFLSGHPFSYSSLTLQSF